MGNFFRIYFGTVWAWMPIQLYFVLGQNGLSWDKFYICWQPVLAELLLKQGCQPPACRPNAACETIASGLQGSPWVRKCGSGGAVTINLAAVPPAKLPNHKPLIAGWAATTSPFPPYGRAMLPFLSMGSGQALFPWGYIGLSLVPTPLHTARWCWLCPPQALDREHQLNLTHCQSSLPGKKLSTTVLKDSILNRCMWWKSGNFTRLEK